MDFTIFEINRVSTLRRWTVKILENLGYSNINSSNNLEDAKQRLVKIKGKKLVILELTSQSTVDELEFLKQIREKVTIIVTGSVIEKEFVMNATQLGVKYFIIKTADFEDFSQQLKQTIEGILNTNR